MYFCKIANSVFGQTLNHLTVVIYMRVSYSGFRLNGIIINIQMSAEHN